MPTYEYQCTKCKKKFDLLQRMSEPPVKKCIHCGAKPERLIGAGAGLIFKGSGFYITDYKRAGEKNSKPETKKETPSKTEKKSTDSK